MAKEQARKYACRRCSRKFNKAEHLVRHEHSHTGVKPFVCSACKHSFTRLDSLTRHGQRTGHTALEIESAQVHDQPPDEEPQWTENEMTITDSFEPGINFDINDTHSSDLLQPQLANDGFFELTWPDSEDLLQSILNTGGAPLVNGTHGVGVTSSAVATDLDNHDSDRSLWSPRNREEQSHEASTSVQDISQIIAEASMNVTIEASFTDLSTTFLDECLHLFFDRFNQVFPVCHRPTFEYRQWSHPLLLNAIAIGSLFSGEDRRISQGEALWKLAHVAVATSWYSFIQHKAQTDARRGVQLVTTALLGQSYAILSRNARLRKTAQMFHSLGFCWASECSLYTTRRAFDPLQVIGVSDDSLAHHWRTWVAEELQLRCLLGHFILDSQIAEFLGASTSQRHASNSLPLPSKDSLFAATTAKDWADRLLAEPYSQVTFRELFLDLYTDESNIKPLPAGLSPLALKVLLEGLRSIVLESKASNGPVVGKPSEASTCKALSVMHRWTFESPDISSTDKTDLSITWHAICIDMAIDTVQTGRKLCTIHSIQQDVFSEYTTTEQANSTSSCRHWAAHPKSRIALLHATAIYDELDRLRLSHAHTLHLPMSIFSAAVVYCGFIYAGRSSTTIPLNIDWSHVTAVHGSLHSTSEERSTTSNTGIPSEVQQSPIARFVFGRELEAPLPAASVMRRNLRYEINVLLMRLRQISQPWGIAANLEAIVRSLLGAITVAEKSRP